MTTLELTKDCTLCNASHTWTIPAELSNCSECVATPHGVAHTPFKRGHRAHCTCSGCF